jgi:threonine dehydratase
MKIYVEPTGCLATAAVFSLKDQLDLKGKRIGCVITGGNVDINKFASIVSSSPQ